MEARKDDFVREHFWIVGKRHALMVLRIVRHHLVRSCSCPPVSLPDNNWPYVAACIFGCIIQLLVAHARYIYTSSYSTITLCVLGWFTLRNVSETCVQLNSGILGCLYEARGTNHIIGTYIMVLFLLYIFICTHRMTWRGQNMWANYWVARKSRTRSVK